MSADRILMQAKKEQAQPDLKYFTQSRKWPDRLVAAATLNQFSASDGRKVWMPATSAGMAARSGRE